MNVKPLLKYFPEIHHLPVNDQNELLQRANNLVFGPENKLRIWRRNMFNLAVLLIAAAVMMLWLGPYFRLTASATGIMMMVVILPLFIFLQQRRHIAQLRPVVQRLLHE